MKVISMQDFSGNTVHVNMQGIFSCTIDGVRYESDTLAGLRDAVLFRSYKRPAEVRIPFTIIENGALRHGVATGVRRIDGSILVRWNDTGLPGVITWTHRTLKPLDGEDAYTYQKLCDARDTAVAAVDKFEQSHGINLKDKIVAAIAAASEGNGKTG